LPTFGAMRWWKFDSLGFVFESSSWHCPDGRYLVDAAAMMLLLTKQTYRSLAANKKSQQGSMQ